MKIDKRIIHNDFPPYIIGEISANHNGSIDNAKKIIMFAKKEDLTQLNSKPIQPKL